MVAARRQTAGQPLLEHWMAAAGAAAVGAWAAGALVGAGALAGCDWQAARSAPPPPRARAWRNDRRVTAPCDSNDPVRLIMIPLLRFVHLGHRSMNAEDPCRAWSDEGVRPLAGNVLL